MRRRTALLLALPLLATAAWALPLLSTGDGAQPIAIFELTASGKTWQSELHVPPGAKVGIGKASAKNIADVLAGSMEDFAAAYLDIGAENKLYLYYYDRDEMGYATNPDGQDVTMLRGQCASDGTFWMYGFYDMFLANADCMFTGKIKWEKTGDPDQYIPLKINGTLYVVSDDIDIGFTLKVKTKALVSG